MKDAQSLQFGVGKMGKIREVRLGKILRSSLDGIPFADRRKFQSC